MKDEKNMAGSFGWSDGIDAQGLQQRCLGMQKGLITTIKHCIILFWISQGNRAAGRKQYLKFGVGVLDIFIPILNHKCISCLLPPTMHQLSYVPFKAA